ncbi:hypothetical protein VCRA2123E130_430016 [Vibrio crassostreae]|nr:hypothetical protein VCRA2123E130_430016 [Vibrio crassostreae]
MNFRDFESIYVSPRRYINVALFAKIDSILLIQKQNLCIPPQKQGYISNCFKSDFSFAIFLSFTLWETYRIDVF